MPDTLIPTAHHQKTYHVPSKFQRKVCMCEDPAPPMFDATKRPAHVSCCSTCRLPFRWNLRKCTNCKEWFIKDFRTRFSGCARHTKCFDCLMEIDEPCCEFAEIKTTVALFGPLGLNPREVPQEERDAAFDMPSVFD